MNAEKIDGEIKQKLDELNKDLYTWIEKARAARIFLFKSEKYKGSNVKLPISSILKCNSNFIKLYAGTIGDAITNEKINAFRFGAHCIDYAIDEEPTELKMPDYIKEMLTKKGITMFLWLANEN